MAEKCDGQLKGMVQDLREIIDHLNASNASQQQDENPVSKQRLGARLCKADQYYNLFVLLALAYYL